MAASEDANTRRRFTDKSIIVTGAGSGIGRETAMRFAREGGQVLVSDIDAARAKETTRLITEGGGLAELDITDVSRPDQLEAMVQHAVEAFGGIDVLHNNAYWAPLGQTVADTSEAEWDNTIATTLKSVFFGVQYALPHLVARRGSIVNVASTAALVGPSRFAAYAAAKGGVAALTRSIAVDFGPTGIRCNAVAPGLIRTEATAPIFENPDALERMTERILVGRVGEPEDIANAVLYLASDESAFVTGQTFVIDGGRLVS